MDNNCPLDLEIWSIYRKNSKNICFINFHCKVTTIRVIGHCNCMQQVKLENKSSICLKLCLQVVQLSCLLAIYISQLNILVLGLFM